MRMALVHDYLTQRGGAERVVLSMLKSFPGTPLYTSLYHPGATFPAFAQADVRTPSLNRLPPLRRHHRLALPLLAPTFSTFHVDADVVLCSSSGWAHGISTSGRKIVYCYNPARWLYQGDQYFGAGRSPARAAVSILGRRLRSWDCRAARTAHRYLAISTAVRDRVRALYSIDPEVLHPPPALGPGGAVRPVAGVGEGFFLCVSRLLRYKNVDAVVAAFDKLPASRLVIVGTGPEARRLQAAAGNNVAFLDRVGDDELRWLYANCTAVVSASYEDYGLTPVEGAAFGAPAVVLRWGGFLDTVVEGVTGVFFDSPQPGEIADAIRRLARADLRRVDITRHAEGFSEGRFSTRLLEVVGDEMSLV